MTDGYVVTCTYGANTISDGQVYATKVEAIRMRDQFMADAKRANYGAGFGVWTSRDFDHALRMGRVSLLPR